MAAVLWSDRHERDRPRYRGDRSLRRGNRSRVRPAAGQSRLTTMSDHACPVCETEFGTEKAVRDHSWDGHDACHHCGERFEDRGSLYTHWLDDHDGDLSDTDRKRAENKVGSRTVCPVCEERFAGVDSLHDHSWDAHGACHHCGDRFDDQTSLYAHLLGAHGGALTRSVRTGAKSAVGDLSFRQRLDHQGAASAVAGVGVGRRAVLAGGTAAALAGIGVFAGGILGGNGGGGGGGTAHPAMAAIGDQPVLGPSPGEAEGTIVAFEDPSCPSCRRFETGAFPTIKRELVDTGDVSFVFRGVPVVYPWGRQATHALEATLDRSEAAFWTLKELYYANQGRIARDNVLGVTRELLGGTGVDADAVVSDVRAGTYTTAVNADVNAFRDAGGRGTPTFFLFRDGSFVTDVVGPQSASVFRNSLGV